MKQLRQVLQQEKEEHEEEMRVKKKTMTVLKEQLKEVCCPSRMQTTNCLRSVGVP